MHSNRRDAGFTLLELMVVCTIIAVVTAAVVPTFRSALVRNRMQESANYIVSAVFEARSRATRTGTCHRVQILLDKSVDTGGSGGVVELAEFRPNSLRTGTCTEACGNFNPADWIVVGIASVGLGNVNDSDGNPHTLNPAGRDVGLSGFFDQNAVQLLADGNQLNLYFEPTGGMQILNGICALGQGYVRVQPDEGPARYVFISAGGAVRYTDCRACPH